MQMKQSTGSDQLINRIRTEMASTIENSISFYRYMEMCLYDPQWGYYGNLKSKIGKTGDFYTSSNIGTIMGEMLARTIVKMVIDQFPEKTRVELVEWGGGNGNLAKHLLDELKLHFSGIYDRIHYISIEASAYHKGLQQEALSEHQSIICWMTSEDWFESDNKHPTIVYSNELLDAFPVYLIEKNEEQYFEIYVTWCNENNRFIEKRVPLNCSLLLQFIEEENISLIEGQRIEISLSAIKWIEQMGKRIVSGSLISIDYGELSDILYLDHRLKGTLMCYKNHQVHHDPYINIGEQDITSHVNFSACIRHGLKVGFKDWTLIDQKSFLIDAGIMETLQSHNVQDPFHPIARRNRAIRQLLLNDQMNESFKVLIQRK